MHKLAITGAIGAGKSTVSGLFAKLGVPTWSADGEVARLYGLGGQGVEPVRSLFGDGVIQNGAVDRHALRRAATGANNGLRRLEKVVHPLVRLGRQQFLARSQAENRPVVALEVPLLFETGGDVEVDSVVVVTAPREIRWKRVLRRERMTADELNAIERNQVSDEERRNRADFILESVSLEETRRQVTKILKLIETQQARNEGSNC